MYARRMDWLKCTALIAPLLLVAMAATADAPPATTPAGTQPATPGGGNPNAVSTHAATPATPAEHDLDVNHLDDASANDIAEQDNDLKAAAKAKWEAMTPDERKAWAKAHPRLARAIGKAKWEAMTPAERADFLRTHPEIRERLIARWRAMTPEQRQEFLKKHPQVRRQMAARRLTHREGDNGVRDHGVGEGRNGVGQGGEHRDHPAPKH